MINDAISRVTFSPLHSFMRMNERAISMEEVIETVLQPDHLCYAKHGCVQAFKRIGPKNIKVIYEQKGNRAHIITVKRDELRRWWRR